MSLTEEDDLDENEDVEEPMSELEKQYEEAIVLAKKEADEHIDAAREHLKKAKQVSEKYGVPLWMNPSPVGQSYKPSTFDEKWGKLFEDGAFDEYDYDIPAEEGWQHSAICY